ncbi:hypothetical protein quinque_011341 [Culex quinquefasciatus]
MLAVSRLTIGQLRPRVAAIGTKKYFAGGTTSGGCTYSRRWFSKKEPDLNKTSPACPPPPPPSKDNTAYIIGAIALTAGGLGLAYKMGLFYGEPTVQQVAPEPTKSSGTKSKQRYPASSKDLPGEVPYLLIGGGTASFAAFRAIKGHDAKAKVLVISNEPEMPRTWKPLKFKQWNGVERSIYYEPDDFYIDPTKLAEAPNGGVAIARGYEVQRIDVVNRKVVLTDGTEIKYGECLLATGARPKNLPVFESAPLAVKEHLTMFKSVSDFEELSQKLKPGSKVAVVGGGFLGSEMSCALAKFSDIREKNLEVYQLFHEEGNMGKILPEYLSQWTTDRVREEGVKVWPKTQIKAVEVQDKKLKLTLTDDSSLAVDQRRSWPLVPDRTPTWQRRRAEVDPTMEVSWWTPSCGHDHICTWPVMPRASTTPSWDDDGTNPYNLLRSMFWSDLGPKIGYEAIGIIDSALPTVAVFAKASPAQIIPDTSEKLQAANATIIPASATQTPSNSSVLNHTSVVKAEAMPPKPAEPAREDADDFNKGVIFYLRDEKVVGVLLWNIFNRIGTARKIVAQHTRYDDLNEVAKLFNLHDRPEAEEVEEEAKN